MTTKKNISPALGIVLILVALGIVFGIMWYQSEAPLVNRLPKQQTMNAPGPPPGPPTAAKGKTPGAPEKSARPAAATGAGAPR